MADNIVSMDHIILVRMNNKIVAISDDDEIYTFDNLDAAVDFADNSKLCQAFLYQIVELDEL